MKGKSKTPSLISLVVIKEKFAELAWALGRFVRTVHSNMVAFARVPSLSLATVVCPGYGLSTFGRPSVDVGRGRDPESKPCGSRDQLTEYEVELTRAD